MADSLRAHLSGSRYPQRRCGVSGPWFENLRKRQVKAPKVYLADTGLLHSLLGLKTESALLGHPKCGASWEGFAMREALRILSVDWDESYYWAAHRGAEIDLLVLDGARRLGLEFKRTSAPKDDPVHAFGSQ